MMERSIVHLDLDAFFVSVERKKDSRLEGKPLIIGGTGDRGVVSSCSYEARRFGVHSAMPMALARRRCPHALVIRGDFDAYTEYSQVVTEIIREEVPVFEKASIDEFYLDMTGMEKFFGCWKYASHLGAKITKETGLPLSFGLSVNKMVSKMLTNEVKPNGKRELSQAQVPDFLAPLSVKKIPSVGKKTTQELMQMGVRTIEVLKGIPLPVLKKTFGKMGQLLYESARGEDKRPVVPYSERKSISAERTLSQDTIDVGRLHSLMTQMVEKLGFRLRKENKLTACVAVKIRYANFETFTKQVRIPYTANDEYLTQKVLSLFEQLYDRRIRVRLIGVRMSHLVPGGMQIQLFQERSRQVDLYQAIDEIKGKYGEDSLRKASGWDS